MEARSTVKILIRQAVEADLGVAYEVQREASAAAGMEIGNVLGPTDGTTPAKFRHELHHGYFLVAEVEGRMVGFGAVFHRQDVTFLATFYVRPETQLAGMGIGQALLDALFDGARPIRAVVSSAVHRALALYARNGLLPRWPLFMLEASSENLSLPSQMELQAVPAAVKDPELVIWDAEIAGRGERAADRRYWSEEYCAHPYWIVRDGERIGYAYIQHLFQSPDAPWNPETVFLGPIGVRATEDAAAAVTAVVDTAKALAPRLALDLPGTHPALPALLEAGFRIFYQATFCSSTSDDFFDPLCYVPADTITF